MTYENNNKYIAEAWINNNEDDEFKTSYLMSLIEQIQGHENGFDADTVDGLHGHDIEEEINSIKEDCLTEFTIGDYVHFTNKISQYYLGFDAIKLFIEGDGPTEEQKTLPWSDSPLTENPPSLLNVFKQLYELTYLGEDEGERESNKNIYERFKDSVVEINERLQGLESALDGRIIDGVLSADSVNGLRFFIYTPEQYQELKETASEYISDEESSKEVRDAHKKLTSIHNVFIIKTEQEIIDSGYPDGVYEFNPDVAVINKYYEFRVVEATVFNETTQTYQTDKWLQYRYQENENWNNLCKASDFIDENKVYEKIVDTINNNPSLIENALQSIPINDNSTIPLAIYNRETYIKGGFYDYENNTDKTDVPIKSIDGFNYLNFTPLEEKLQNETNEVQNNLDDYKIELQGSDGRSGVIGDINRQINGINNDITVIKGGSDKTIGELDNTINSLTRKVNELEEFKNTLEDSWQGTDSNFKSAYITMSQTKHMYFKKVGGIVVVDYYFHTQLNKIPKTDAGVVIFSGIPEKFQPQPEATDIIHATNGVGFEIFFTGQNVKLKTYASSSSGGTFTGQIAYKCR